jgi:hypothetical protein
MDNRRQLILLRAEVQHLSRQHLEGDAMANDSRYKWSGRLAKVEERLAKLERICVEEGFMRPAIRLRAAIDFSGRTFDAVRGNDREV